ncbi:hypothetical protein ISN39_10150 [Rhizobium sp. 007]|nr:hypothetical protein ISN39_10150 [Rhizobium sp. 007]
MTSNEIITLILSCVIIVSAFVAAWDRGEGSAALDRVACAAGIEPAYRMRAAALKLETWPSDDCIRECLKRKRNLRQ